ncbi:hypothetical protein [Burkholderia sp. NLJ2]|uniref:hypothetical protein n=1 Tax=Burkholderia sp. NLJ2 TaxID=3090699 RepID=UPI003C6CC307
MALLSIDRDRMAQAAMRDADRHLTRYICETLAPVLPRLPTQAELIPPFVRASGQRAIAAGFGENGLYNFHVLTDLLLGPYWERDPFYADRFEKILDAPGMEQSARLALAMHAVIQTRQALERALPDLLDAALAPLKIHPEVLTPNDTWRAFQQIALARGVHVFKIREWYEFYETEFRERHGLPPVKRHQLTAYAIIGYEAMGQPIPRPTEDIRDFDPHLTVAFNAYLLVTLIYGPFHRHNPLLARLNRILDDTGHLGAFQAELARFLRAHQTALTEPPHDL